MKTALIIPTLNAGAHFIKLLQSIQMQSMQPDYKLVVDSSSDDNTKNNALKFGFTVKTIERCEFDHGGTRTMAMQLFDADIYIFLTQDTLLINQQSIQNLVNGFENPQVGAAYGKQVAYPDAGVLAKHARYFNYPDKFHIRTIQDASRCGIKTAFISNSFAAYRREAVIGSGGFPQKVIMGEDTVLAAKMLLDSWSIAYCADSLIYHSHNYSLLEEFRRYFDIGVLHKEEAWLRKWFGNAGSEGLRYVISELRFLYQEGLTKEWPHSLLRNTLKIVGYKLGNYHSLLPLFIKKSCSMHRFFWHSYRMKQLDEE